MFSDSKFWRLVWKEYRTQRPLWLTLLIATPVLQVALLVLMGFNDGPQFQLAITPELVRAFCAIGYVASAIYLLGCCATMFSVEHETGTFDFQRVLPANQPRLFWAKVGFAGVSTLLLTAILWIESRGFFLWAAPGGTTWLGTYGVLYMVEIFAWSILASLLIRQPLWGVIGAIAAQSLVLYFVLPYFTGPMRYAGGWPGAEVRLIPARLGIVLALVVLDIILGRLWFEDGLRLPRWRFRLKPDIAPSYPSDAELPPYLGQRQIGWSRLLWLGWRDGRWVQGAILAWFWFEFFTRKYTLHWNVLLLPGLTGSFVCGLFAFAPEQWSSRFRYLAERGCSPRKAWFSRQAIWLSPALLMSVATIWLQIDSDALQYPPNASPVDAASRRMMAALGPLLCYSAGQFAAMLFRSTAIAIAVSLALTIFGFMWGQLMTSCLAPTWWSVGSLPVIGLFVTWLKANDWVEERRDRVARWRLALGLGVPVLVLLVTCATYRVVQIPVVSLPAEWGEDGEPKKLTAAETETLDIYRRALAKLDAGNKPVADYETRVAKSRAEHSDWTDTQHHQAAFNGFHKDWLVEHAAVVPLLKEAHSHAAIPLALLQPDLTTVSEQDWMTDKTSQFSWLMVRQARETLEAGQLDDAWQEIEVTFELIRRYRLRASADNSIGQADFHERMLQELIADWGRHPEQSRDRIVTAIRRFEQMAPGQGAALHPIHWNLLLARIAISSDERSREFIARTVYPGIRNIEQTWAWKVWRLLPWERWRSERVLRVQAFVAVLREKALREQLEANQPLSSRVELIAAEDPSWVLISTTLLPPNFSHALSSGFNPVEGNRAALLRLALADWHREHGRFPKSLSELAPTYFAEVPCDPQSAGPFVYFPHGVPKDVTNGAVSDGELRVIVPKGIPFLATPALEYDATIPHQKPDGSWEFKTRSGKFDTLSHVLRGARIWLLENDDPKSDL